MFHFKSWLMVTPSNLALVTNSRDLPLRTRGSKSLVLNILLCEKTGIGSKSVVKLKFLCTSYASNLCCEMLYLS